MAERSLDPARSPIFVIGAGRSGTTLLRLMLCAHPRIYIAHEPAFYMWEQLFPKRAPRRDFLAYYFQTFSFRWLRLDPARVMAGQPDPLPRERLRDVFETIMREKAADYGRVRYGEKTPAHAAHLRKIFRDFPDARVIHIVRDPRATAASLSRMPWASRSVLANALVLDVERIQVEPFRSRLLEIRLEDLLADSRRVLGRVLDYVGEPWDERVLDHVRHIPDRHDMPAVPWLEGAWRDRAVPAAPWESLSPVEVRIIENAAKRAMKRGGYEPARFDVEPGFFEGWWRVISREIPESLRCAGVYLRVALRMRHAANLDSDDTHALFRRINPQSWARYPGLTKIVSMPEDPSG